MRAFALTLASAFALVLLVAACGGDDEGGGETTTTAAEAGECEGVEAPRGARAGDARAADRATRRRNGLLPGLRDELRVLHDRARPGDGSEHVRVARRAHRGRVLRRHDLPPRRPRLRHPGRRPHRDGHGRPRLQDGRRASGGRDVREGRRRDGEDRSRAPGDRREPVLRRDGRERRACRPSTRSWAR